MHAFSFALWSAATATAVLAAPLNEDYLQPRDSPVAALFQKRYTPSPSDANFSSNYPDAGSTPGSNTLPASWTAKLASITLPNVSVSSPNNGYPTYADGENPADSTICSFTYQCVDDDDLYEPPQGVFALNFDDGPTSASPSLYSFLAQNNISSHATHFMIGGNILYDPTDMQAAATAGGHIAVHTWSHPYMTTLTNEQILGEIGWTMQIISDLNGGRLPKYWRPPYGDVDNRVRAIAQGVFGLVTVVWNQDSADWAIGTNSQYTIESVEAAMDALITSSDKTGMMFLEHELNDNTVNVFKTEYPKMVSNGWNVQNVADAFSMDWYQNSDKSNTDTVTSMAVAASALAVVNSTTVASSTVASNMSTSAMSSTSSAASSSTTGVNSASRTSTTASAASAFASTAAASSASSLLNVLPLSSYIICAVALVATVL